MGNDTPGLTKEHLTSAADELDQGKVVLGPSRDGGFYLMGFHRSQFEAIGFLTQPWQSCELQISFVGDVLKNEFEIKLFDVLSDIDILEDILDLIETTSLIPKYILNYIHELLQIRGIAMRHLPSLSDTRLDYSYYNKGSPLFFGSRAA